MEGRKTGMILIVCIMVVAAFATGTTALREDAGAIPPSPMESGGVAVGVPAALAVLASVNAFTNDSMAQWIRRWSTEPEILGSIPSGVVFDSCTFLG
ncbi:hypothetical protein V6N13_063051 [Hibiscus sabdariffa]|uniref:Uncharacterized protein n=2 Tax=Hibiscus sabdariffa TaxID=183260 RepID=A0ABR2C3Z9_9ROSI